MQGLNSLPQAKRREHSVMGHNVQMKICVDLLHTDLKLGTCDVIKRIHVLKLYNAKLGNRS
jgi:hypothetical protein